MDMTLVITIICSALSVIAVNISLFSWLKSDIAAIRSEQGADRRDLLQIMREIREENKDFHGRMRVIEHKVK